MVSGYQLWIKLSGFELRLGILCCVLEQNTLLSHYSPQPSEQMGTTKFYVGGSPAKDLHPIQGVVEILLTLLHATETGMCSDMMGQMARMQT